MTSRGGRSLRLHVCTVYAELIERSTNMLIFRWSVVARLHRFPLLDNCRIVFMKMHNFIFHSRIPHYLALENINVIYKKLNIFTIYTCTYSGTCRGNVFEWPPWFRRMKRNPMVIVKSTVTDTAPREEKNSMETLIKKTKNEYSRIWQTDTFFPRHCRCNLRCECKLIKIRIVR